MKKLMFSLVLLTSVYALSAQEVTVYRLSSTTNNQARVMTPPPFIVSNFQTTYPGVTVIAWDPVETWWRASYNKDNRVTHVYYTESGENYRVALPVLQNNVPEEIVSRAITSYGPVVYAITRMKSAAGNEIYQVKLLDSGEARTMWLDNTGSSMNESDVYKVVQ
jgi:hypothetical protein